MEAGFLIYLQDAGGTNYLLPILSRLSQELKVHIKITYLVHPLSQAIVANDLPHADIVECPKFPISIQFWHKIFKENNIKFVLSTLSANHYDMSNANLIVASKNASIPTIGFLDHWKGFDRLIDDNKDFSYCPNWLGVIDDFTVSNLSDYNLIARIESVGHPVLESLINRKAIQRKTKRIVFVSQPEVENKTYNSLFLTPYRSSTLLAVLTDSINNSSVDYQLYYRPHPKESPNELLGSSISLDTSSKNELYDKYDIFIGFDSMLLLEAQLAGASSLSIRFAEVKTVYRDEVPYPYALKIENILDFEKAIAGNTSYSQPAPTPFVNSSNRCFNFINSFIGSVSNA